MRLKSWHFLAILFGLMASWIFAGTLFAGVPQTKVWKPTGDKLQVESGGEIEIKSGGTLDIQSGATTNFGGLLGSEDITVDDLNTHETMILGETTAKSTFTPTAVTLDDGLTLTANGPAVFNGNINQGAGGSTYIPVGLYLGTGAAISTMTPTAVTLDDGVALTNNGTTSLTGLTVTGLTTFNGDADSTGTITGAALTTTGTGTICTLSVTGGGTISGAAVFSTTTTIGGVYYYPPNAAPRTNITPGAEGSHVWNSADKQECISTGTVSTSWVQAADGTTACSH